MWSASSTVCGQKTSRLPTWREESDHRQVSHRRRGRSELSQILRDQSNGRIKPASYQVLRLPMANRGVFSGLQAGPRLRRLQGPAFDHHSPSLAAGDAGLQLGKTPICTECRCFASHEGNVITDRKGLFAQGIDFQLHEVNKKASRPHGQGNHVQLRGLLNDVRS